MKRHWRTILAAALGLFFLYAGGIKLFDPLEFSRAIGRYRMTGAEFSWFLAFYIPWMEVLAGISIVARRWRDAASVVLLGLMAVFQTGLLSAMVRGLDISCGCFGNGPENGILVAFIRNIILIILLIVLIFPRPSAE